MAVICPTVTATDPHTYRQQMARVEPFAQRIHIDFADGVFAPQLIGLAQAYWPEALTADLHLMYRNPLEQIETVISLKPSLTIIHAEAEGDLLGMLLQLQQVGIKAGVALLKDSQPEVYAQLISTADHILLFSGNLGHFGGTVDTKVLDKVAIVKTINPTAELGWDGGVNAENAPLLIKGGVEVLDVGGFIHKADDPAAAFAELKQFA